MQPYVADLSRMETGTMKRPASVKANSFIDWSGLREQVVLNLPPEVKDHVTQGATSYEFGTHQPAALNLLGYIDTTGASPFLIPVSSYNKLLEAAGEKAITLGSNEAVFYLNPDFREVRKKKLPPCWIRLRRTHRQTVKLCFLLTDSQLRLSRLCRRKA